MPTEPARSASFPAADRLVIKLTAPHLKSDKKEVFDLKRAN